MLIESHLVHDPVISIIQAHPHNKCSTVCTSSFVSRDAKVHLSAEFPRVRSVLYWPRARTSNYLFFFPRLPSTKWWSDQTSQLSFMSIEYILEPSINKGRKRRNKQGRKSQEYINRSSSVYFLFSPLSLDPATKVSAIWNRITYYTIQREYNWDTFKAFKKYFCS